MDLARLNAAIRFLPTRKLKELTPGRSYLITEINRVNTKYGTRINLGLNNEFTVFLPEKALAGFDEQLEVLQQAVRNKMLKLVFNEVVGNSSDYDIKMD